MNYEAVDLTGYYTAHATAIRSRYERLFGHLSRLRSPARVIDIGAGMGFSVEVATAHGWRARGLEPNRFLAEHAQARGLDVVTGYLDERTTGQYELILVDNVLEHILQPKPFLRHAASLMTQDGLMLVAVPPLDWLRDALGRSSWVRRRVTHPHLNVFAEADEHVNMLGRHAMTLLTRAAGLHVLPLRFHPNRIYDNPLFRVLGLDDGYYHIVRA